MALLLCSLIGLSSVFSSAGSVKLTLIVKGPENSSFEKELILGDSYFDMGLSNPLFDKGLDDNPS